MPDTEPSDEAVVEAAATAAEGVISARLARSDVADLDVRVRFEEGILEVDVYVEPADDADVDDATLDRVADDAALAARGAVDELFADG